MSRELRAALGLFAAMILFGASFPAMKLALTVWPAELVNFGRMASACLALAPLLPGYFRSGINHRPGDWKLLALFLVCEPCLLFIFEMAAVARTTAAQAGMITATLPLICGAAAWLVLGERVSRRSITGLVVSMLGVAGLSLSAQATETAPAPLLGNFFELLAMTVAAVAALVLRTLGSRYPAVALTAMQTVAGTLFFGAQAALSGSLGSLPEGFPGATALACVLFLGLGVTFAAYALYNHGVSVLPAAQATVWTNAVPVFSLLFAWMLLGEGFSPVQFGFAGVILGGVVYAQTGWAPGGGKEAGQP